MLSTRLPLTSVLLVLVLVLAGCGNDSGILGPGTDAGSNLAESRCAAAVQAPGFSAQAPEEAVAETQGVLETALAHAVVALPLAGAAESVTQLVLADNGGVVHLNRFRVVIPAGALSTDTFITIRNPGNGYFTCELEPHGIQFNVPVTLEMDLGGLSLTAGERLSIYWLNLDSDLWEDQMAAQSNTTLSVPLNHFSQYSIGRGGW